MHTINSLRKQAKQKKLHFPPTANRGSIAFEIAKTISNHLKQELPTCFGLLFNKNQCVGCAVMGYCNDVYYTFCNVGQHPLGYIHVKDSSLEREKKFISVWKRKGWLRNFELEELSKQLFDSIISIPLILSNLKKAKLLEKSVNGYRIKKS